MAMDLKEFQDTLRVISAMTSSFFPVVLDDGCTILRIEIVTTVDPKYPGKTEGVVRLVKGGPL